uniref:Uncharacterized protein n=1 Tax=Strongyloides stercoralis TaxID=6248 RepID=A0A0K0EB78_STRER
MNLIKKFLFIIFIFCLLLNVDTYKFRCKGFFRPKPPCYLRIDLEKTKEFTVVYDSIVFKSRKKYFLELYKSRFQNALFYENLILFGIKVFDPEAIEYICLKLGIKYLYPTHILFFNYKSYGSKKNYKPIKRFSSLRKTM